MTGNEFDLLATELFGEVLLPLGFTHQKSARCTFYRLVGNEVFHFVMPDIGRRGAWYDIRVFPHTPAIYPLFDQRFPDNLGIPTDRFSLLSEKNVGPDQSQFHCKNEDAFRRDFAANVGPSLARVAIPYLDRFRTVADIVPVIRHPSFLGFALYHVGRFDEARSALQQERERLRKLDTSNKDISVLLERVEQLLGRMT